MAVLFSGSMSFIREFAEIRKRIGAEKPLYVMRGGSYVEDFQLNVNTTAESRLWLCFLIFIHISGII